MSPSAMFLHTHSRRGTRCSHKRRQNSSFHRGPQLGWASPRPRGRRRESHRAETRPPKKSGVSSVLSRLHFKNSTTLAALSCCRFRVYNPWKSPPKPTQNSFQVYVFRPRWVWVEILALIRRKYSLVQSLFDLFCFVLLWVEEKTPFWRLFTTVRQQALRMRPKAFWESE